jgi:hypothetical protein
MARRPGHRAEARADHSPCSESPAGVIPPEACRLGWQESLTLLAKLVEAEIPE